MLRFSFFALLLLLWSCQVPTGTPTPTPSTGGVDLEVVVDATPSPSEESPVPSPTVNPVEEPADVSVDYPQRIQGLPRAEVGFSLDLGEFLPAGGELQLVYAGPGEFTPQLAQVRMEQRGFPVPLTRVRVNEAGHVRLRTEVDLAPGEYQFSGFEVGLYPSSIAQPNVTGGIVLHPEEEFSAVRIMEIGAVTMAGEEQDFARARAVALIGKEPLAEQLQPWMIRYSLDVHLHLEEDVTLQAGERIYFFPTRTDGFGYPTHWDIVFPEQVEVSIGDQRHLFPVGYDQGHPYVEVTQEFSLSYPETVTIQGLMMEVESHYGENAEPGIVFVDLGVTLGRLEIAPVSVGFLPFDFGQLVKPADEIRQYSFQDTSFSTVMPEPRAFVRGPALLLMEAPNWEFVPQEITISGELHRAFPTFGGMVGVYVEDVSRYAGKIMTLEGITGSPTSISVAFPSGEVIRFAELMWK